MITWGASISQRQPTCRPRFESQAHQLCFNHLKYLCHICNVKKTKRGRVWHNKKNRSLKTLLVTSMVQIRDKWRTWRTPRTKKFEKFGVDERDRSIDRSFRRLVQNFFAEIRTTFPTKRQTTTDWRNAVLGSRPRREGRGAATLGVGVITSLENN